MMKIPVFLCVYLVLVFRMPVFGQDTVPEQDPETEEEAATEPLKEEPEDARSTLYIIQAIRFDITGRTRPLGLLDAGNFEKGEMLWGKAGLEAYIQDKTQLLLNQRVLAAVSIDYVTGASDEQGFIPVDLLVSVIDTLNIVVLPYPQYSDNDGFKFTLKARDYNFLGSMNALRIDLGYQRDTEGEHSVVFEIDSDTPFNAFGYDFNLNFDHAFSYTFDQPLYYKNTTGISMELPYKWTAFTFGFEQATVIHEENEDKYKPEYGDYDDWFTSSELYTSWKIPTGFRVHTFGEVAYIPKIAGKLAYPQEVLEYFRRGPTLTLSHKLEFGRIDWIGNYRRGLEASLDNAYQYNLYSQSWNKTLDFSMAGHVPIRNFFGISGRLRYRHWFDDDHDAGDALRGMLDKSIHVPYMVSLNLDFPFRILRFTPSQWLNNQKLRLFNGEVHASPFIDVALLQNPRIAVTGGLELIAFPELMRSFYARVSLGWNLIEALKTQSLPSGANRELFIGIGHHY
ncbi:MAG: hypothetical protein LBK43_09960 [Treponema sp.]|nr:hypothetical protein [Treponema sp.]